MMKSISAAAVLLAFVSACSGSNHSSIPTFSGGYDGAQQGVGVGVKNVSASGYVTDGPNGLILRVDATGLAPGFHGVHLHQVGDCSDADAGFKASGSHINPGGKQHGLLHPDGYEVADLPNIFVGSNGHARAELFVAGFRLSNALDNDGFSVVIHENADDHISQPIGGAGPRKACIAFQP